jgi:hypothetical protein
MVFYIFLKKEGMVNAKEVLFFFFFFHEVLL